MINKENKEDREWMIRHWANFIRTHSDKEWSKEQKEFIDSVI
jgi:hypothetical protein